MNPQATEIKAVFCSPWGKRRKYAGLEGARFGESTRPDELLLFLTI
jgi:hypothetical protein